MGKIKISIHNLYKNNINYNMIGGAVAVPDEPAQVTYEQIRGNIKFDPNAGPKYDLNNPEDKAKVEMLLKLAKTNDAGAARKRERDAKEAREDKLLKEKQEREDKLQEKKETREDQILKEKRDRDDKLLKAKRDREDKLLKDKRDREDQILKEKREREDQIQEKKETREDQIQGKKETREDKLLKDKRDREDKLQEKKETREDEIRKKQQEREDKEKDRRYQLDIAKFELEKEKIYDEKYTLAQCRTDIKEYMFYNLRNQILMSELMTKYKEDDIKKLLKENNFDFVKVEKILEADRSTAEGKIVIKVPKIY